MFLRRIALPFRRIPVRRATHTIKQTLESAGIPKMSTSFAFRQFHTETQKIDPSWMPKKLSSSKLLHSPMNYQLVNVRDNVKDSDVYFYVLGCAGTGNDFQTSVAKLMHDVALQQKRKPKFIIILGDNFYQNGVQSEHDPAFKHAFENMYQDKELTELCNVPCFVGLGNHDHYSRYERDMVQTGELIPSRAIGQILYSRLLKREKSSELDEMYSGQTLDLKRLKSFNMPSSYYSCTIPAEQAGGHDLEMYFIDSTNYIKDYLKSLKQPHDIDNQVSWLERQTKVNPNAIKILFSHHPRYALDKRYLVSDVHRYLTKAEQTELKKLGIEGNNYSQILDTILRRQGLKFDADIAAHMHSMSYQYTEKENKQLCQVIAGGGGGRLKPRINLTDRDSVSCYLKHHGFVAVNANLKNKRLTFDYHTKTHHLRFQNNNAKPLKANAIESPETKLLHEIYAEAYHHYFDFISTLPSAERLQDLVTTADDIMNIFNQHEDVSFSTKAEYLIQHLSEDKQLHNDHSLLRYFTQALEKHTQLTYEQFIKNPIKLLKKPDSIIEEVGEMRTKLAI